MTDSASDHTCLNDESCAECERVAAMPPTSEALAEQLADWRVMADEWRTAALLKVRTRRAISERVQAGDDAIEIANEYNVPLEFVTLISTPGYDFSLGE